MEALAAERSLSVAEIDLQRYRTQGGGAGQPRPVASYRNYAYPELTSAPVEFDAAPQKRADAAPSYGAGEAVVAPRAERSRRPPPPPSSGEPGVRAVCAAALRGALYDLLHFDDLPAEAEGYSSRLHYVCARDGRAPLLLMCVLLLLAILSSAALLAC